MPQKLPDNKIMPKSPGLSLEQYLQKVAHFSNSTYGKMIRDQFQDIEGSSELAMLVAPTAYEMLELEKAVAIMTPNEKQNAAVLTDDQIQRIAADARIDPANFAIFMNGYILYCKQKNIDA